MTQVLVVGGTVQAEGGAYVCRQADEEILSACRRGGLAYVLDSRQVGKSSLMVHAASELKREGARVAIVDLTLVGTSLSADQWFHGILTEITRGLNLKADASVWWDENSKFGSVDRFTQFFRDVVLKLSPIKPTAIFFDEIDTILSLPFRNATDDFFAAIRGLHLGRAHDPDLGRLAIVLLGTASPSDLIADPKRTPFNLGQRIELTDFTENQILVLLTGSIIPQKQKLGVLRNILAWTGGQPYLTLRILRSLQDTPLVKWNTIQINKRVRDLFFRLDGEADSNLEFVRDMLIARVPNSEIVLKRYLDVIENKYVLDEQKDPAASWLKLAGVVRSRSGLLELRNRIYRETFTAEWARQTLAAADRPTAWQEAERRILDAEQTNASLLDLSGLDLAALPDSIQRLRGLRDLLCSGNQIRNIPDWVANLTQLQSLQFSNNQISTIPDSLLQLTELEDLNLFGNKINSIPPSMGRFGTLRRLDLGSNQIAVIPTSLCSLRSLEYLSLTQNLIQTIPDHLSHLVNLQELDLSENQLSAVPSLLGKLTNLQNLDISANKITILPPSLAELSKLRNLNLSGNIIGKLPIAFSTLSSLAQLDLSANEFTNVPHVIGLLNDMQDLNLSRNHISFLPRFLNKLTKLEDLNLSDNEISVVPDFVALPSLQYLNLSNNKLIAIQLSLSNLSRLTRLFLHGNSSLGIPEEILGPTVDQVVGAGKTPMLPRGILQYYLENTDSRPLDEAKLIMVGYGGVGKSSLVKRLTAGKFKPDERATEGIKIRDWVCPLTATDNVTVHIWDFGGQEMMHATHQFFLTQRSLYLLVLNRRQGSTDREADYWFRLIRAFGGKDAPVIVVLNKQKLEPFDVNRGGWLEKYANNIKGFVETDCTDDTSITRLKRKIQEELKELSSVRASFPRRWFAIKEELSRMEAQFVTFEHYRAICRKHGERDPDNQTVLADFLHDLGIAFNYKNDPRLRFAYVLKPEWVTDGIYALLHAFVASKGLFSNADAEKVLSPKGYSPEAAEFILGLMEQFELCFPLGDNQKRLLIPQLLDDQQPNEALTFKATECLNFGYQYTIVPEGLLPRFIVRTHHLSQPAARWKSGVILRDQLTGCRALVRADSTETQIRIHIDGTATGRRELLAIIRYNLQVIHSDYEFKPSELVYPPGIPEKSLRLDDLEAMARSGATSMPVVLGDSVITPSIASLMEPVRSDAVPLKLFLSYSHRDERYVDELRKDLRLMERNGLIRTWYDHALTAGEKWEPRILQELNEADAIVCQLSRDFLHSDFCVLTELKTAIERQKSGEATLIAYVLTECGWKEVPELSQFQVLPKDAKPLIDWKDKNKYWRAVAEGIQSALKELQKKMPERRSKLGSIEAKISGIGSLSSSQS